MTRTFYPTCRIEVGSLGDEEPFECDDAEVWIEQESILISYFDEDGIVVLEGRREEEGGWLLGARSRPRRAILRPDPGVDASKSDQPDASGNVYRGFVEEQGERTPWLLRLCPPAPPEALNHKED